MAGARRRGAPALSRLPPDDDPAGARLAPARLRRPRDGRCRGRGRRPGDGAIACKWPNDLVVVDDLAAGGVRKVAGVLGESDGLGSDDPRVVIGIGINADWRREDFPAELAGSMTSLREASNGRPIDRGQLLDAFLNRLEARVVGLRQGWFAFGDWASRQVATGRMVRIAYPDGRIEEVRALGVDAASGGLVVERPEVPGEERVVHSGEIHHVRLPPTSAELRPIAPVGV